MTAHEDRCQLSWTLTDGIAGYFQYLHASGMIEVPGEDTAQYIASHVLHDMQRYRILVSQKPPNWPEGDGRRIDIALRPRQQGAAAWYGAIEIKWITNNLQRENGRKSLIQDAARLASVEALQPPYAKLLVVGFLDGMLAQVFDNTHPQSVALEAQRTLSQRILIHTLGRPCVTVTHPEIYATIDDYQNKVPDECRWQDRGLNCELLARTRIMSRDEEVGQVLAWHVNKQ